MQHYPRPVVSDDDSGINTDVPDVFSDNSTDEFSDSASELDSDDDPEDLSDDDSILDDEERELPAAHYLQEAEHQHSTLLVPGFREPLNLISRCLEGNYALIIWCFMVNTDSFMPTEW